MRSAWFVFALLLAGCTRQAETEPLWIGHLAPLSGPDRERGEEAVRAMQLALEEAKAAGTTFAGREVGVRHVDAGDKATTRAEAVRLLAVNRVLALIVGPGVRDVEEVIAAARGHGAAVVVLEPDPEEAGKALARYARTKLKLTRMRVAQGGEETSRPRFLNAFTAAWREGGGTITNEAQEGVALLRVGDPPGVEIGGAFYAATVYAGLPGEWRTRFEKRYHQAPTGDAVMGHDGLGLLLATLEKLDAPSRKTLLAAVAERPTYAGLTGTLRQTDGRWRWPLFLVRRQAGKGEVVETIPVPER